MLKLTLRHAHSSNNYFFQNAANHQVCMDSLGSCTLQREEFDSKN